MLLPFSTYISIFASKSCFFPKSIPYIYRKSAEKRSFPLAPPTTFAFLAFLAFLALLALLFQQNEFTEWAIHVDHSPLGNKVGEDLFILDL